MSTPAITNAIAKSPGAVSVFFVVKAGLFAIGFWGWSAVLLIRGGAPSSAIVVATAGAVTTTLIGVQLGLRFVTQRNAAMRHAELMKALVDLSWQAFTSVSSDSGAHGRGAETVTERIGRANASTGEEHSGGEPLVDTSTEPQHRAAIIPLRSPVDRPRP